MTVTSSSGKKYCTYPEHKNSGIAWLGEVPVHWRETRAKFVSHIFVPQRNKPKLNEMGNGISWATMDDMKEQSIETTRFSVSPDEFAAAGSKMLPKNSVIASCVGNFGVASISKIDLIINQQLQAFIPFDINAEYLKEIIYISRSYFELIGTAATLVYVNQLGFENLPVLLPPKIEQEKIINFLKYETSKIDALISKQERLIELLKEKRQAVISHAVTRGLNPDTPMKDSGVEWLGQIPKHWGISQAKYIADITRGAILRPVDAPEYFDENGEWAYLNISDATKCNKYLYDSKLRLSHLGSTKSARVEPDNVIITASATIGKAFINKIKVCIHDGFIPFCNAKVNIDYLYHFLCNPYLYAAMGKSNTQKNIYLDEVKNMMFTIPPDDEQKEIVSYLERRSKTFNDLIDKAIKGIELIKERKTALISAAVTGKIDVRNWQEPIIKEDEVA